jgi:hypothetical protein
VHPITAIEIASSVVTVTLLFIIAWVVPKKIRKISMLIATLLTLILLSIFAFRPFWIAYQVSIKTELLDSFLEGKYPNEEWEIDRRTGRQYNPYHLVVTFKNEEDWTYTYSVVDEDKICQNVWTPPEGKFPKEGKHYEGSHCE